MSVTVGRAVLGAAPWPVMLGGCATATFLFGLAAVARHGELLFPLTLLGLGVCGATTAYALDEASAEVEDATPTGRSTRVAWRLGVAALPVTTACLAVLWLDRLDGVTGWDRLLPVATGGALIGLAVASGMRRTGRFAPGDLAGATTFGLVVLLAAADPLRRWISLVPLETSTYPTATAVAWSLLLLACGAVVVVCARDPGRANLRKERS